MHLFRLALFSIPLSLAIATTATADDPLQIGYSFNEGTRSGTVPTDYYGVLDGQWTGNWTGDDGGSSYFVPGYSGEEGDYAIITEAGNRVRSLVSEAFGQDWGSFTMEAHVTVGEAGSFRRLFHMVTVDEGGSGETHYATVLQTSSLNQLRSSFGTSQIQTSPALQQDQWYHAALVLDTEIDEVRLYLDGSLVGTSPAPVWPDAQQIPRIYIGASNTGGSFWNGKIDNVRITQAALDPEDFLVDGFGTELEAPPPPPPPLPDAAELQFFWTELDLGEIHTSRADSTGQATLVTDLNRPIGLQVDEDAGYLYWAEDGVLGETGNGRIGRATLTGGDVTVLYAATDGDPGLDNPQHIAIDPDGGMIYWADFDSGIYRAPLDGSGPVETVYVDTGELYTSIALDLVNGRVYFGNPQSGELFVTDLDGSNFNWVAFDLTNQWGLNGLIVDPVSEMFYFSDTDAIRSANFSGLQNQQLATGLSTPLGLAFGPDGDRVFFAERGGQRQIGVVHTDGSGQQAVLTGLDNPFGVAVIQVEAAGEPYQDWLASFFDTEELADENVSGHAATPAGDGIPNLLKFVLGLEPKTPSRDLLPQAEIVGGELQLTYNHSHLAAEVDVVVEVSNDLVSWETGPGHVELSESETPGSIAITATAAAAYSEDGRAFMRLRVMQEE